MDRKRPGRGRGRLSSIDLLPEDIRVELNDALRERRLTQAQIRETINTMLAQRDEKPVSRSALNRYAKQAAEKGAMLQEAREAANQLVGGLGEQSGTDLGRAVTELVKTLTFDLVLRGQGEDVQEPIGVDTLNKVALIAQRIERASKISLDRETAIRDRAMADAAKKVEVEAKRQGASASAIDSLRAAIMTELSA